MVDPFEIDEEDGRIARAWDTHNSPYVDEYQQRAWKRECSTNGWPHYCHIECARLAYPKAIAACGRVHCRLAHQHEITAEFPSRVPKHPPKLEEKAQAVFKKLKGKSAPAGKRKKARGARARPNNQRNKRRKGAKSPGKKKGGPITALA